MKPFTFKKQPRETGLRGVANPTPATEVKLGGKRVGTIHPPSYRFGDDLWSISVSVKQEPSKASPASFRWIKFKQRFETEAKARNWLLAMQDIIASKWPLHVHEENF